MEEKKKRFRPTLTAYRALESEVSELKSKNETLEKSNVMLEEELKRTREFHKSCEKEVRDLRAKLFDLNSRKWWQRLFKI